MRDRVLAAVGAFVVLPGLIGLCIDGWHGALIGATAFPLVAGLMAAILAFTWILAFVLTGEKLRLP